MPSSRSRRYDTPARRSPVQTFDALAGVYIPDLQARNASVATIRTYEESFDTCRTGVPPLDPHSALGLPRRPHQLHGTVKRLVVS